MIMAAREGHTDAVKSLIGLKADVNVADNDGVCSGRVGCVALSLRLTDSLLGRHDGAHVGKRDGAHRNSEGPLQGKG